jgi:metallophosphoesterase superfamily enzyme
MTTIQERRDVKKFLSLIEEYGNIHVIPGNHDGNIRKLASENIIIHPSTGLVLNNTGFVHGHCWPKSEVMKCDQLIMAHTHPTVMFLDRLNFKTFEPCWVKGHFGQKILSEKYPDSKNIDLLIMPAFNPLCGGTAVNLDGIVGPLGKLIDIKNAQIYLIDGASLGKVENIK